MSHRTNTAVHRTSTAVQRTTTIARRTSTVTKVTRTDTRLVSTGVFLGRRVWASVSEATTTVASGIVSTITAVGWLVVVLLLAGAVAGIGFGWSIGWVLLWGGLVILVCSVPFLLGGNDHDVRLRLEHDRVVAGSTVNGFVDVHNPTRRATLPSVVDVPIGSGLIEAHVPLLRPDYTYSEPLTIAASQRGVISVGPLRVVRGDPVGILRRDKISPEMQTIYVHPQTTPLPGSGAGQVRDLDGLATRDIVPSDLSFHAIREYRPGDAQRHVHWKSTAKTGRLMVRQYEETRHSRTAIVLAGNTEEYANADEYELAVSVAASIAQQAVRENRDIVVTAAADAEDMSGGSVASLQTIQTGSLTAMLDEFSTLTCSDRITRLIGAADLFAKQMQRDHMSIVFLVAGSATPLSVAQHATVGFAITTMTVFIRCELQADPSLRAAGQLRQMTVGALGDIAQFIARGALGD